MKRRRRAVGHRRQGGRRVARQALATVSTASSVSTWPRSSAASRRPSGTVTRTRGAGVAQDAGLAAQVVLDLRQPRRRIDRHRHGAGVEDAEEGDEEVEAGRQHQRDAVARHDVALDQAGGDAAPGLGELAVGQRPEGRRASSSNSVTCTPVGMVRHVPLQHLDQGAGFARRTRRRHGCVLTGSATSAGTRPGRARWRCRARRGDRAPSRLRRSPGSAGAPKARSRRSTSSVRPRLSMPRSRSSRLDSATSTGSPRCPRSSRTRSRTMLMRSRSRALRAFVRRGRRTCGDGCCHRQGC